MMTIEAAICVYVFMTLMLSLASIMQIWEVHQIVQESLVDAGESVAVLCHDNQSHAVVYAAALQALSQADLNDYGIVGGAAGVNLLGSTFDSETGQICLQASYKVKPSLLFISGLSLPMHNRVVCYAWCGYKGAGGGGSVLTSSNTHYYITENEAVYHTNPECTHIKLTIRTADIHEAGNMKNNEGRTYAPCSKCKGDVSSGRVYITPEGDCYHTSLSCSGLKRTVYNVTDTGGLKPCSRCGG